MRVTLAGWLIGMLIGAAIGAVCFPYAINEWLVFAGKEAQITWWQGALMGFVPYIGHVAIPFAVVTWLLMMFIN